MHDEDTNEKDTKIIRIEREVNLINYKVTMLTESFTQMKDILSKQTDLFSTFALVQERQLNTLERVREIERQLEKQDESINKTSSGIKIIAFLLPFVFAAGGYWVSRDIESHNTINHRLTVIETEISMLSDN